MASTFYMMQNDTSRAIKAYLEADVASDFVGATATFSMRVKNGAAVVDEAAATIATDTGGYYGQYAWTAPDTAIAGKFEAHFEITLASGKVETYPNKGYISVQIEEDI